MAKNNKFGNLAARRFGIIEKVDTIPQEEIFYTLKKDMEIILGQFTANRNKERGAKYPNYMANAFANLSTALFFYKFVKKNYKVKIKHGKVKVIKSKLSKDDLTSIRQILADAYKKSAMGFYDKQAQEYDDRPKLMIQVEKFEGLSKSQRRDLAIQIWGEPIYNMRLVHKVVNESTLSNKKKLKLLRKVYGKKRFVAAAGAALTVESNNSECVGMLYEFINKLSKKKRARYIMAYAEAYKKNKTRYFQVDDEFFKRNKGIIKELKDIDIGYKKAFKSVKAKEVIKPRKNKRNFGDDDFGLKLK